MSKYTEHRYTYKDLLGGWIAPRPPKLKEYDKWEPAPVVLQKDQDQLINLTFEKIVDHAVDNQDFIPIVYQRQNDKSSHFLLMFDIEKM